MFGQNPAVPVTRAQWIAINPLSNPPIYDTGDRVELNTLRGAINRNGVNTPNGIYTVEGLHRKNGTIMINGQFVARDFMSDITMIEDVSEPENESQPELDIFDIWGDYQQSQVTKTTFYKVGYATDPFGGSMYVIFRCSATLTYTFNLLRYPDVHQTRIQAEPAIVRSVFQPQNGKIYNEEGQFFEIRDQGIVQAPRFFQDLDSFTVNGKNATFTVDTNYFWTIYESWNRAEKTYMTGLVSFTFNAPDF